jgi:hypothetical protein
MQTGKKREPNGSACVGEKNLPLGFSPGAGECKRYKPFFY